MKLLFQGDSITDAFRKPDEINPAYQLGNGYVFLVAARLGFQMPCAKLEFVNRGVSGDTVHDLVSRWQRDTIDLEPDFLTLLVGVNDTIDSMNGISRRDDASFTSAYSSLLYSIRTSRPQTRLIVLEPFLLVTGDVTAPWREHLRLRQKTICTIAAETGAEFVPLQSLFDDAAARFGPQYWCFDGIHPTHTGFQLLADEWLRVFLSMTE